MIGLLPDSLTVNGVDYPICSDYRIALLILEAFSDPDLSDNEKAIVCLTSLYKDISAIPKADMKEAFEQAAWFIDGGEDYETPKKEKKIIDWKQDEKLIFSAVNKVAGQEVRSVPYMHWWTFLGLFREIGECTLTSIIGIREKLNKGKKLDEAEQEFFRRNKEMVKIKTRYSEDEEAEIEALNKLLGD